MRCTEFIEGHESNAFTLVVRALTTASLVIGARCRRAGRCSPEIFAA
jgi:hypothetical protein